MLRRRGCRCWWCCWCFFFILMSSLMLCWCPYSSSYGCLFDVAVDLDVLLLLKKKKMMMMMMMMVVMMMMMDNGQYEKDIKHDQTHCGSPKSWGLSGDALWVSVRLQIGKNCQPCFIHVRETILLFLTTFTTFYNSIKNKQYCTKIPTASKSTTVSVGILAASMSTFQMETGGARTRTTARTSRTRRTDKIWQQQLRQWQHQ